MSSLTWMVFYWVIVIYYLLFLSIEYFAYNFRSAYRKRFKAWQSNAIDMFIVKIAVLFPVGVELLENFNLDKHSNCLPHIW